MHHFPRSLFPALLLAMLLPRAGMAHWFENIESLSITNYTSYIIASDASNLDPGYNRDAIMLGASIRYATTNSVQTNYQYQLAFRLLDSQNNAVSLVTGAGQTGTTYTTNDSITLPFGPPFPFTNFVRGYGVALKPAARLSPYDSYRVELRLYERPGGSTNGFSFTGDESITPSAVFYHFTNTVSSDMAVNGISRLNNASFSRTYAVKTVPNKQTFQVDVSCGLRRYDAFAVAPSVNPVAVNFTFQLTNVTTGAAVPLATNQIVVFKNIPTHIVNNGFKSPAFISFVETLDLEPAAGVQLDSVNHTFRANVTISHLEVLGPLMPGNSQATANERLLHFNGWLFFDEIATRFTSIDNVPDVGAVVANSHVNTHLGVDNNSGYIVNQGNHTYGDGTDLSVRLLSNGNARYVGISPVNVNEPSPDLANEAGVRFERQDVTLNAAGVQSDIIMTLPTGFGFRGDTQGRRLNSQITWNNVALTQNLIPASDLVYSTPFFACEETKPFWIGASSLTWHITEGSFTLAANSVEYVRKKELNELEAAPNLFESDMYVKRSNEQYFRWLDSVLGSPVTVTVGDDGDARLSVAVDFKAGAFVTHFPYDSRIEWNSTGEMFVENDKVATSNSLLHAVGPIANRYNTECPGCSGSGGPGLAELTIIPSNGELHFTIDGGLAGSGALSMPTNLNWGWISSLQLFAQRTDTPFTEGSFLMSGSFLRGDMTLESTTNRASVILLTGVLTNDLETVERPDMAGYHDGFGDYAGINFRVPTAGSIQAESVIAGQPTGLWDCTARSKYYTRLSGVSGIHEAVQGTFPSQMMLYGYQFTFDNYGVSYLSSQIEDSRTEGRVFLPVPSNFFQNFEEMRFSCVGALEDAKVPKDEAGDYKVLEYWNADFVTLAIGFDREDGLACDPSVGYLVLGVKAHATYVPEPLFGALGFKNNGNLVTGHDVESGQIKLDDGFDSRLKLPNNFKINGPTNETYTVTPVADAYFNDWENRDDTVGQGFMNIAAEMDLPFFENLKVHIHTSAKTNSPQATIHLMGGWPDNGFGTASDNFFTNPKFDHDHTGFPKNTVTLTQYRDSQTDRFHPRAQTEWLGVIDFDYPLAWSSSVRTFQSWTPITNDFLVIRTEHLVKYLSSKNADLTFGAQYDSLPVASIANIAYDMSGFRDAFLAAGQSAVRDAMELGFGNLDQMLNANLQGYFHEVLNARLGPEIGSLYNELKQLWTINPGTFHSNKVWKIDQYCNPASGSFIDRLENLASDQNGLIDQTLPKVDSALAAIDAVLALFAETGGKRTLASQLAFQLLRHVDPGFTEELKDLLEVGGAVLDDKFNEYIAQYDQPLDQIHAALTELRNVVASLKTSLSGGEFAEEMNELFFTHQSELQQVVNAVGQDLLDYFDNLHPADYPFNDLTSAESYAMIRQKIEDGFYATPLAAAMHSALKQRLYDADAAIREATDTAFAQLNGALRDLVNFALTELDNTVKGLVGDVGGVMSAGNISGYAHINGDSLKLLRLDASAMLKVPDEMGFKAYFQIKELDSDGTPTECLPKSGRATEVTLGAKDVKLSFIQSNLTATVGAKFTFDPGPVGDEYDVPVPLTMGGNIDIGGSLKFGPVEITRIHAGLAFGVLENYITAGASAKVNGYSGSGGFFIGRSCTLGFLSWDPEVEAVLGTTLPFTGAYAYGEVWIPISEVLFGIPASCMFQVSGGVGMGAGFFVEGPTFVGKAMLGLDGDFLCVASLNCTLKMAGKANPDGLSLRGKASVTVEIGPCPLCAPISKDITMTYANGEWDADF